MKEEALKLGKNKSIIGVLTHSDIHNNNHSDVAILLLNAGLIHHTGPNRIYVDFARSFAKLGFSSFRFDFSGLGDSSPRRDNLPILEMVIKEPQEIMNELQLKGFNSFILMGICSGAYSSFKTACSDSRVVAAVMLNPQDFLGDPNWMFYAYGQRYVSNSIYRLQAWKNLFTGKINYKRLVMTLWQQVVKGLLFRKNVEVVNAISNVKDEVNGLQEKGTKLLFVISEDDISVIQFSMIFGDDIANLKDQPLVKTVLIPQADHLFTKLSHHQLVVQKINEWLAEF